jgi:hypothetical protein
METSGALVDWLVGHIDGNRGCTLGNCNVLTESQFAEFLVVNADPTLLDLMHAALGAAVLLDTVGNLRKCRSGPQTAFA